MAAPKIDELRVGLAEAAVLTGRSRQWIRSLVKEGYVEAPKDGRYLATAVVQGVIRYGEDERRRASKSTAQARLVEARSRQIELRNAQAEKTLMPTALVIESYDLLLGPFIADLGALPARVSDDVPTRRRIEDQVDGVRSRHADRMTTILADLDAGRDPFRGDEGSEEDGHP